MKKILPILLCITVIAGAFVGCSGDKKDEKTTATTTTAVTAITTDNAKIKEADAINLIESYSDKELGLTKDVRKECSFMVASDGEAVKYNGKEDNYIKVVAVIKNKHEDEKTKKVTFTFDYKGEYYIRFDGKQILMKDLSAEQDKEVYKELEVKAVPTTTTISDEEAKKIQEEHSKQAAKTTTKKK